MITWRFFCPIALTPSPASRFLHCGGQLVGDGVCAHSNWSWDFELSQGRSIAVSKLAVGFLWEAA
jgi:hypothetical protein